MFKKKQHTLSLCCNSIWITLLLSFSHSYGYSNTHPKQLENNFGLQKVLTSSNSDSGIQETPQTPKPPAGGNTADEQKSAPKTPAGGNTADEQKSAPKTPTGGNTADEQKSAPKTPKGGSTAPMKNTPTPPKRGLTNPKKIILPRDPKPSPTPVENENLSNNYISDGTVRSNVPETNTIETNASKNHNKKGNKAEDIITQNAGIFIGLSLLLLILGLQGYQGYQIRYIAGKRFDEKIIQQTKIQVSEELKKRTERYHGINLVSQDHFDTAIKNIENHTQAVKLDTNDLRSEFNLMRQNFITMNTALNSKDNRIKDLEAGIDSKFKKLFATSFLKPYRRLVDPEYKDIEATETVEQIKSFLLEAMELCDIQEIRVGEDTVYSPDLYPPGSVRVVKQIPTDKKDQDRRIIKVHLIGYQLTLPSGGFDVISPCEVSIHTYNPQSGVHNA